LNEDSSWDDLMYKIYVKQSIDSGISDSQNGKTIDVKDLRKMFGLQKNTGSVTENPRLCQHG